MTKVILFDIDGTLVLTGGAGVRGMARAFEQLFAVPDAFQTIDVPGRTDSWILAAALALHGVACDAAGAARFREVYLGHLREELQWQVQMLPHGVVDSKQRAGIYELSPRFAECRWMVLFLH